MLSGALARVFRAVDALVARGVLASVPTFFEVSTAAAFVVFADAAVDIAVVEVGLGGRFDATNVITPVAAAITTIDFDHERHLGTTLTDIAREKAGIAKAGVPLIVGDVPDDALHVIEGMAQHAGAPVTRARHHAEISAELEQGHARLVVRTPVSDYGPLRLGLAGAHQAGNALVAIRLLEALGAVTGRPVPRAAIESALAEVRWPARLEWLRHPATGARVLVDAAHNPAGARALGDYLAQTGARGLTLVTSVMADKNVAGVLGPLLPYVDQRRGHGREPAASHRAGGAGGAGHGARPAGAGRGDRHRSGQRRRPRAGAAGAGAAHRLDLSGRSAAGRARGRRLRGRVIFCEFRLSLATA